MQQDHPNHQGHLLKLAAVFLGIYALALTFAPAARARTWEVPYRWDHWAGYLVWLVGFWVVQRQSGTLPLPKRPPYLSRCGIDQRLGTADHLALNAHIWIPTDCLAGHLPGGTDNWIKAAIRPGFLRRYKYIWLTSGLVLTTLTLIYGTNPYGVWPPALVGVLRYLPAAL